MQSIIDSMGGMSIESQTKVKSIFKNCFKVALQNDVIQKELNSLGIKSVYFSDQSSVLNKKTTKKRGSSNDDPVISDEAQNLLYFM